MRTAQGIANQKIAKQEWKERNREGMKLKAQEHHARHREERNAQSKERYRRNPERWLAQLRVQRAIKKGVLVPEPCPCGNKESHAHHEDYSKPLDVIWLCKSCHQRLHICDHKLDEEKL